MDVAPSILSQGLEHSFLTSPSVVVDIPQPPSRDSLGQSRPLGGTAETSQTPLPPPAPTTDAGGFDTDDPTDLSAFTNSPSNDIELDEPSVDEPISHTYYKLTLNQHKELWEAYNKQADEYDKVLVKRLSEDLNTLLIFVSISFVSYSPT